MKKRAFLLPLAASLTALVAGAGSVAAKSTEPSISSQSSVPPGAKPLVLKRVGLTQMAQSHSSHGSHGSHGSHTSSR
jgi:hypothetical protein